MLPYDGGGLHAWLKYAIKTWHGKYLSMLDQVKEEIRHLSDQWQCNIHLTHLYVVINV